MPAPSVLDVSEGTFEQDVVARSHDVAVVVDFWAAWCGPCRALGPLLERLATEADGAWLLTKVDVDANPGLAARFGIQGIPAVRAFRDGKEVAEFVGALPEPQVRRWLEQLGPSPASLAYDEGSRAEQRGDRAGALDCYRRVLGLEPGHAGAREAVARLELAERVERLDVDRLRERLEADPVDVEAATGLADAAAASGNVDAAAAILIDVIKVTSGSERDRARLHLLRLLDGLPPDHPASLKARKDLSLALY